MKIKRFFSYLLGIGILSMSLNSYTYAFQYEGIGTLSQSALDTPDSTRAGARAEARYYFKSPDTAGIPLAEAAFLDRASSIYTLADASTTTKGPETPNLYLAGFGAQTYFFMHCEFLIPCNRQPSLESRSFYFEAFSFVGRINGDNDVNSGIRFGAFAYNNLLLAIGYQEEPFGDDSSTKLNAKWVVEVNEHFVNLELAGATYELSDDVVSLEADWYINNSWSLGLGARDNRGNNETTVRTRKFFNQYIAAALAFTSSDLEDRSELEITLRY